MMVGAGAEARAFGRYLVGAEPPQELIERYRVATARLFPDAADPCDEALVDFAARHAWSVAPLDAAAALVRRDSRLREKLLVMAAVLETTPRFADDFLPRACGRLALLGRLTGIGLRAIGETAVGLALYAVIRARA